MRDEGRGIGDERGWGGGCTVRPAMCRLAGGLVRRARWERKRRQNHFSANDRCFNGPDYRHRDRSGTSSFRQARTIRPMI